MTQGKGTSVPDQALAVPATPLRVDGPSGFDPSRVWHYSNGEVPNLREDEVIYCLGRYGDIYGPLPFEMIDRAAWTGYMLHSSHDINAYAFFDGSWRQAFPHAIAMEARQGRNREDGSDPKDDSAGPQDIAQGPSAKEGQ